MVGKGIHGLYVSLQAGLGSSAYYILPKIQLGQSIIILLLFTIKYNHKVNVSFYSLLSVHLAFFVLFPSPGYHYHYFLKFFELPPGINNQYPGSCCVAMLLGVCILFLGFDILIHLQLVLHFCELSSKSNDC
jgi:hypothetical protein